MINFLKFSSLFLILISSNSLISSNFGYVNIKDTDTKKKFNLICIPLTGIVIPKSENFSLSYQKNSIILELILEDKLENIEKNKEDTI